MKAGDFPRILVSSLLIGAAISIPRIATADDDPDPTPAAGRKPIEDRNGTESLSITRITPTPRGGSVSIAGRYIGSAPMSGDERKAVLHDLETAWKTVSDAAARNDPDAPSRELTDRARRAISSYRDAAKAQARINPTTLMVTVVPGRDRSAYEQFTVFGPPDTALIALPTNPAGESGDWSITLRDDLPAGDYTVILTPIDGTSVNGSVLFRGSDAVNIVIQSKHVD